MEILWRSVFKEQQEATKATNNHWNIGTEP